MSPSGGDIVRGAILLTVFACSSGGAAGVDGGGGDSALDGGDSIASVSSDFAKADCARKFECMPYASATRAFGDDVADCARETAGYFTRSLSAPGASSDFSGIRACIAQTKAATCQDYLDGAMGLDPTKMPACTTFTPGKNANGAGCAYGRQCASDLCQSAEGTCGKCGPVVGTAGAACNPTSAPCDLAKGLICGYATMTCVVGKRRGEACSGDCFYNLVCNGTCQDYPNAVNAACNPVGVGCSFRLGGGLVCNNQSNSCQLPDTTSTVGAACGLNQPNGGLLVCAKGAMCDGSLDGFSGKCIAGHASPPGGTCAFQGLPPNGPSCEAESVCSGGTCRVDDPATCP